MLDTCHAQPMIEALNTDGIIALAASATEEESQSVGTDRFDMKGDQLNIVCF